MLGIVWGCCFKFGIMDEDGTLQGRPLHSSLPCGGMQWPTMLGIVLGMLFQVWDYG